MAIDKFLKKLGPLAQLSGIWEGAKGHDIAPSDNRGREENHFREKMVFTPFGPVDNHEQQLFGLRYSTTAWKLGEDNAFHEELGYWLWDSKEKQVIRCFMVPRGVIVLAGGTVDPKATTFELSARAGSDTYGICSNLFLDREFKTIQYDLRIQVEDGKTLTYEEDTQLKIKGRPKIFHHRDKNILIKIS